MLQSQVSAMYLELLILSHFNHNWLDIQNCSIQEFTWLNLLDYSDWTLSKIIRPLSEHFSFHTSFCIRRAITRCANNGSTLCSKKMQPRETALEINWTQRHTFSFSIPSPAHMTVSTALCVHWHQSQCFLTSRSALPLAVDLGCCMMNEIMLCSR